MESPREKFVSLVCRRSYLALWSYASPRGRNGRELCDTLIVCEPDVVIVSTKDVSLPGPDVDEVAAERWRRKAIGASVGQIYGAERWLAGASQVVRDDGRHGIPLPPLDERRIHRIAVALGAEGRVPFSMGDFGRGFVHVLDEDSFEAVIGELDTVADLVQYLTAKEELVASGTEVIFSRERDLLAFYLNQDRKFPAGSGVVVVEEGLWDKYVADPAVKAKKEADRKSYRWDWLVDKLATDTLDGNMERGNDIAENERALRVMAQESRFNRRALGEAFEGFMDRAREVGPLARLVESPSGHTNYVFVAMSRAILREHRTTELQLRCFAARGMFPNVPTVVGVATEVYEGKPGFSLDLMYVHLPTLTDEQREHFKAIRREFGYFQSGDVTHYSADEYPRAPDAAVVRGESRLRVRLRNRLFRTGGL